MNMFPACQQKNLRGHSVTKSVIGLIVMNPIVDVLIFTFRMQQVTFCSDLVGASISGFLQKKIPKDSKNLADSAVDL